MTFRFVFKIKVWPGHNEAFLQDWRNGSRAIQQMPGARGTRLHKSHGEEGIYIAIAEWESREARIAAYVELTKSDHPLGREMRRWGSNSDHGKVTLLAEIDEIDAVFPPTCDRTFD
jgi:heme-degrading monooxygenase HmoA